MDAVKGRLMCQIRGKVPNSPYFVGSAEFGEIIAVGTHDLPDFRRGGVVLDCPDRNPQSCEGKAAQDRDLAAFYVE